MSFRWKEQCSVNNSSNGLNCMCVGTWTIPENWNGGSHLAVVFHGSNLRNADQLEHVEWQTSEPPLEFLLLDDVDLFGAFSNIDSENRRERS